VYALGTVLFESLVGHSPFVADHDDALALARLQRDPPPARASRPDVSPALEAVIARALARDPGDRYPTAALFADALRRSAALRAPAPAATRSNDTTATLVSVLDPTAIGSAVASADEPVPEPPPAPPAHRNGRRSFATLVVVAIMCGAAALAFALIAGSLAP
jgi:serine/threonine-protein kinase